MINVIVTTRFSTEIMIAPSAKFKLESKKKDVFDGKKMVNMMPVLQYPAVMFFAMVKCLMRRGPNMAGRCLNPKP